MITAFLAFFLYWLGCIFWKQYFPFDKFELYADTAGRKIAAIPIFLCEQKEANIWEYEHFSQIDPERFLDHHLPTSVTWMVEEMAQWLKDHPLTNKVEGNKNVQIGFRILSLSETNTIKEEIQILTEGRAWKK